LRDRLPSAQLARELFALLGRQRIDPVINDARLRHVAWLEEVPEDRRDRLLGVMLKEPLLLARAARQGVRAARTRHRRRVDPRVGRLAAQVGVRGC
jgi:hypothetical protein